MFWKFIQKAGCALLLLAAYSGSSFGQNISGPLKFHGYSPGGVSIATYSGIKSQDFKKLIIASFEQANFTFVSTQEESDAKDYQSTLYKFSYSIEFEGKKQTVHVVTKSNGVIDRFKKCTNCFVKYPELADETLVKSLPWMLQYELSRKIFPDLDLAYEKMEVNGQKWMDQKAGFNYTKQWQGERNFSVYGNSYAGVEFSALKREVIQVYASAGFYFVEERIWDSNTRSLIFNFPITDDKKEGVVYVVKFLHQLSSTGGCAPCEMTELFNPYQKLPALGLAGVADRLTLESRFSQSRVRAFDLLKDATSRFLRPKTEFLIPPKPLPLGSTPPAPRPPVVT